MGKNFYNYVKNGQYTNNDIVYFDWKGFLIQHWGWSVTENGDIMSGEFEVIDAYNPQGSLNYHAITLLEDGKLIAIN